MAGKRNDAIDILKFFAAVMVLNSHLGSLYGVEYQSFTTWGALGDALFFFCSGFGLFLSSKPLGGFADWYKRRIRRIYPTVIAWALLTQAFGFSEESFFSVILYGGGWFVTAIMVYYVFFYVIQKWFKESLWIPCTVIHSIRRVAFLEDTEG